MTEQWTHAETATDLHAAFAALIGQTITLEVEVRREQIIDDDSEDGTGLRIYYVPITRTHSGEVAAVRRDASLVCVELWHETGATRWAEAVWLRADNAVAPGTTYRLLPETENQP